VSGRALRSEAVSGFARRFRHVPHSPGQFTSSRYSNYLLFVVRNPGSEHHDLSGSGTFDRALTVQRKIQILAA